ncbi:pheromone A receptor-domain-containing protein [Clohesyomyces aquaticus]|uniref:Pheromone A receptor-domain-containing protein n=1 Tax=Clohesyomyces aquaticus TaxID=1231657 RepID=A0A1Y1ZI27_9PLEO|nr:pheromone A receptor-domain-containing protein [Clohesyomyces aquaticus]
MSAEFTYPVYPTAVILPVLALPAVLLDIPPLIWHISQRNIATWSIILWIVLANFFNFINPLIWPTDNVLGWWDGDVFCDIQVRIFVGFGIGLPTSTMMVMRRLAKVMDTHNITVAPTRSQRRREMVLEYLWCWGFPLVIIIAYYIVQPIRYWIFAISGCVAAYDRSWPSLAVSWAWAPIVVFVATYYAGLLVWRLHRYRQDFHRLIAARNTTKSRFMRLFILAMGLIIIFLPYSIWNFYINVKQIGGPYSWKIVHGENWNTILKVPTAGGVRYDKWAQIAVGYIFFFIFGFGTDANNSYKRILCAMGFGKIFPSLYRMSHSGESTPTRSSFAKRSWFSFSSAAKTLFSQNSSVASQTLQSTTNNSAHVPVGHAISVDHSVDVTTIPFSNALHPTSTAETQTPILAPLRPEISTQTTSQTPTHQSFFRRLFSLSNFTRNNNNTPINRQPATHHPVLPLFYQRSTLDLSKSGISPKTVASASTPSPGVLARAWATSEGAFELPASPATTHGVHVIREVRQNSLNEGNSRGIKFEMVQSCGNTGASASASKEARPEFMV